MKYRKEISIIVDTIVDKMEDCVQQNVYKNKTNNVWTTLTQFDLRSTFITILNKTFL